jgi:pyruvate formate lyase activating enzyme
MDDVSGKRYSFAWHGDIRSVHVLLSNPSNVPLTARFRQLNAGGSPSEWEGVPMQPGESWRFIIAKSSASDMGPELIIPDPMKSNLHEVFDRAHFPTATIDEAPPAGDISPFPIYHKKRHKIRPEANIESEASASLPLGK